MRAGEPEEDRLCKTCLWKDLLPVPIVPRLLPSLRQSLLKTSPWVCGFLAGRGGPLWRAGMGLACVASRWVQGVKRWVLGPGPGDEEEAAPAPTVSSAPLPFPTFTCHSAVWVPVSWEGASGLGWPGQ